MIPNVLDRQVWANSEDPDQTLWEKSRKSDQGQHCLSFCLYVLDALLFDKITLSKFQDNYIIVLVSEMFGF